MNKEIKYQDIIKTQSLLREMGWQQEEEVYQTLKDYLRRADDFIHGDILTQEEKKLMSSIEVARLLQRPALVNVYGQWYSVVLVVPELRIIILDRRLSGLEDEGLADRVFIWEVQSSVIRQE
jgi:putative ribosome biogenesis GTPase RsgA